MAALPEFTKHDARAVDWFRQYLRFRTVHPEPTDGYEKTHAFLQQIAEEHGLEYRRLDLLAGHPTILLKWEGKDPTLTSIVLNSHMDVVPAEVGKWTKDPWAADIIDGKIYGRGTQDMKSVGIQYLEAVVRLKEAGYKPRRTVYILWVPDEEVGGNRGMKLLLGNSIMRDINAGLVLDEGLASPTDKFNVFYGERKIWWIKMRATGPTGHGSRFIDGTAVEKLMKVANRLLELRAQQKKLLEENCGCGKQLGDYTTVNMTMIHAGDNTRIQYNVIPTVAEAGFDCRIPATVDLKEFKAQLDAWCADADVTYELVAGTGDLALDNPTMDVSPESYWWKTFSEACAVADAPLHEPSIFPAASDSRWVRMIAGTPCFGFSPMRNTPVLLHEHDEYIPVTTFLEGVRIYEKMIPHLAEADAEPVVVPPFAVSK